MKVPELMERVIRKSLAYLGDLIDDWVGMREPGSLLSSSLKKALYIALNEKIIITTNGEEIAPHEFIIHVGWECRKSRSDEELKKLQEEIRQSAIRYIWMNGYYTRAEISVQIKKDVIANDLKIKASHGEMAPRIGSNDVKLKYDKIKYISRHVSTQIAFRITALEVETDKFPEGVISLSPDNPRCTIGRLEGNDIQFDHPGVSPIHAVLAMTPGGDILLADAQSEGGTFVNQVQLSYGEVVKINSGDTLILGSLRVVVYLSTLIATAGNS
jgi:FHA domain